MKKYLLFLLLCLQTGLFAQTLWTDYAKPPKLKHSKKYNAPDNPYIIDSPEKLAYLALQVNSGKDDFQKGFYKQTKNIDLSGHLWIPIGVSGSKNSFQGYFDGNSKIINNLTVDGNSAGFDAVGLFGFVVNGRLTGVILSNVNVQGCNKDTLRRSFISTGALAGLILGSDITIIDCHVRGGKVQGGENESSNTGGIIGRIDGEWTITKCSNSSTVVGGIAEGGGANTGGIIGTVTFFESSITQCLNTGLVSGGMGEGILQSETTAGGIIGAVQGTTLTIISFADRNKPRKVVQKKLTIDNCTNTGNVNGAIIERNSCKKDDYSTGGIAGSAHHGVVGEGKIVLNNLRNTGIVTAAKSSDNGKPVNSYCRDLVGRESASNEYGGELHYW
jgi:hypothetical protein